MSFGNFCRNNKIALGITVASTTLGIILVASGVGLAGGLFIFGGIIGIGYLGIRAAN